MRRQSVTRCLQGRLLRTHDGASLNRLAGNVRELKNTMDRAVIMAEGDELVSATCRVR